MSSEKSKKNSYHLDSLLTTQLRFFIMTLLAMYDEVDFSFLKKELKASDGNLGIQLRKLEDAKYLTVSKEFVERKPRTSYSITELGLDKLNEHLSKMSSIQKKIKKKES